MSKKRVLFLCTGNSCRSQMAEAIVNAQMGDAWEAVSAGTHPESEVNQFAIQALSEIGNSHRGKPKLPEVFRDVDLDLVVTVCDSAAEHCPKWLGKGNKVHRNFDDPAKARGSDEEILAVYRRVLGELLDAIPAILNANR